MLSIMCYYACMYPAMDCNYVQVSCPFIPLCAMLPQAPVTMTRLDGWMDASVGWMECGMNGWKCRIILTVELVLDIQLWNNLLPFDGSRVA